MRTAALVVALASMSSIASAGTYVGLGIGSEANGSATLANGNDTAMDGFDRSGRLMLGTRLSRISIEGQASRYELGFRDRNYQGTQAALLLKLSVPLGNNFELFGKGGVQRTWLTNEGTNSDLDVAGSGLVFAGGFEYRLNLGVTAASVFVDYQRSSADYKNDQMTTTWNGSTSMWTLGATVSL
jgi:hypothetical protein